MPETLRLIVLGARYRAEASGFTVLECEREGSGDEIAVVGHFPVLESDELISVTGDWRNTKYGRQFFAESVVPLIPTTMEGVEAYLAAGRVPGVGKKLARRLVDHFGADLFRIIDEEPDRLREVPGIGPRTHQSILFGWESGRGARDVMVFLAGVGINGARAVRIHKHYQRNAVAAIRENPYRLAYEVHGFGFELADSVARKLGFDEQSQFRRLAALKHVIDKARQSGHCGISASEAIANMAELLDAPPESLPETIAAGIRMRIIVEDTIDGRRLLFDPMLYEAEERLARALRAMSRGLPAWHDIDVEAAIAAAEEGNGIPLDATQRQAIELALRSRAIVITGGPGVGKTTLARALLEVYRSAGLRVLLCAPTGRAAKRLSESAGVPAVTIHRLLETSPQSGRFLRDEENPLQTDVLVIDEASMIDVPMLDAVLRAMPPGAGLVLVGDADQLPSIGPGQVLHDILASGRVPSIRLTEIHRQQEGSDIVVNAHRIHRGDMPLFGTKSSPSNMFLFNATSGELAADLIVDLVANRIPARFGLHPLREIQVLAPMRKGAAGVRLLNEKLQAALNPPRGDRACVERSNGELLQPGDKVMQTENNYHKGVFNGDIGVIATVDADAEIFNVDFGGESIVDYAFEEADQLTLAYATTIHKSQGSEYEAVVIAILREHRIMLRRNLLYTAVTRGRKLVIVVGDRSAVQLAVRTGGGGERLTRLRHCLASGR